MLIDLIFRGMMAEVNFGWLEALLVKARDVRFHYPEDTPAGDIDSILKVINANSYVDFVVSTDHLKVDEREVRSVFVNLGRDDEAVELLFFFDINDLGEASLENNIGLLKKWTIAFEKKYKFSSFTIEAE